MIKVKPRAHQAPARVTPVHDVRAYDLARDLVREMEECGSAVIEVDIDEDGAVTGATFNDDAVQLIERRIHTALLNGGIAP